MTSVPGNEAGSKRKTNACHRNKDAPEKLVFDHANDRDSFLCVTKSNLAGTTAPFVLFLWKYLSINGKRLLQPCFAAKRAVGDVTKLGPQCSRFRQVLAPFSKGNKTNFYIETPLWLSILHHRIHSVKLPFTRLCQPFVTNTGKAVKQRFRRGIKKRCLIGAFLKRRIASDDSEKLARRSSQCGCSRIEMEVT